MPLGVDQYIPETVRRTCRHLRQAGGRAFLVGGCVRDMALGLVPKDFDIEVYGLNLERLHGCLEKLGRCQQVGKSFGVFKLWVDDHEIDVSLPRTERKTAAGHRGFSVSFEPDLDPATASGRRDFTINAMMYDPLAGRLEDFHGGRRDLDAGVLRHVSSAFAEDPLRVLRGVQFASRFRLTLDPATASLCRALRAEAGSLAWERIWAEWQKWADGGFPSYGLRALRDSGWIELYPELSALVGCPQDPEWHPEGDVWTHTCLVADQAARVAERNGWIGERRWVLLFAALVHDLGKPATTFSDADGRTRSMAHSLEGVDPARELMRRIGAPAAVTDYLSPLVKEHLTHLHGDPTDRAVRRLAQRLQPADIELWEALVEADASGRSPLPASRPALPWLEKARMLASHQGKTPAIVTGRLLARLGVAPGPEMGRIIHEAYEAQLDGVFSDETEALAWCRRNVPGR